MGGEAAAPSARKLRGREGDRDTRAKKKQRKEPSCAGKKAKEQLTTKVLVTNKPSVDITRVYGLPYGGGDGGGSGQADIEN
jgi:hypothetical protein